MRPAKGLLGITELLSTIIDEKGTDMKKLKLIIAIQAVVIMALLLSVVAFFLYEPPHRDLGYGAILEAPKMEIAVYRGCQGSVKTRDRVFSFDYTREHSIVSDRASDFVRIHNEEYLTILRSNWYATLGGFTYDAAAVIYESGRQPDESVLMLINTKSRKAYMLTEAGWGRRKLSAEQLEILSLK